MSTEAKDDVVAQVNPLELSDEDFLKAAPPAVAPVTESVELPKDEPKVEDETDEDEPKEEKLAETAAKDDADETGDSPDEEKAPEAEGEDGKDKKETKEPKAPGSEEEKKPEAKDDKSKEPVAVDFESEYKRLLAPFKANGRDIKVDSVDEAITLMQMGANYNKKMAALKPNLKLMKMLENNGFLSEDKIGFLIDLGKKDPGAISKLVKESGIDPMDLDAEKAGTYKQNTYAVADAEIELDTVLDELQGSPAYNRTLDIVSNKWDAPSKQIVAQSPQLLKVMHDHVASGIYDRISTEVERQRMLGQLNGLTAIEAYRQVGDAMHAKGSFNDLLKPQAQSKPAEPVIVEPKPKQVDDDKLKDKRRAASPTKPAAPSKAPADFNPLAMSDEEFSKLSPKFM
jgi:hypothetical protein